MSTRHAYTVIVSVALIACVDPDCLCKHRLGIDSLSEASSVPQVCVRLLVLVCCAHWGGQIVPPWGQHPGHACACVAAFGFCIRPCVAAPLNNCPNFRPRPVTVWTRFDARPCPALLLLYKGGSGCGLLLAPSPPFSGVRGAACCLPPFLMAVLAAWPMAAFSLNVMAQASGAG